QEIINAFARFGIDLEIFWKPRITDLEYLGNKVVYHRHDPYFSEYNLFSRLEQWHYFRSTHELPQLKPAPRLLVVHNDKQTFMRRSNLRYYQASPKNYQFIHSLIFWKAYNLAWHPEVNPLLFNEVKIIYPHNIKDLHPKVQEFYNLIKSHKFPPYYNILKIQLKIRDEDKSKYDDYWVRYMKTRYISDAPNGTIEILLSTLQSIPRKITHYIPNIILMFPDPVWFTPDRYIEKFTLLTALDQEDTIETVSDLNSLLNQGR
ncbi:32414_t:CDS:2, partial [Racocetra persica]